MMSLKAFVLVLTLVAGAVIAVHGEEETTEKSGFADAAKEKWDQGVEGAKKGIAKAEEALQNAKEKGEGPAELAALGSILDIVMGVKEKVSGIVQGIIGKFVGLLAGRNQEFRKTNEFDEPIQSPKDGAVLKNVVDDNDEIGPMASNFSEGFKEKFNEGVQKAQDMFKQAKETISSHVSPFVNKVRKGMLDGVRNLRDKLHKKDKEGGKDAETKDEGESNEKDAAKAEINSGEDGEQRDDGFVKEVTPTEPVTEKETSPAQSRSLPETLALVYNYLLSINFDFFHGDMANKIEEMANTLNEVKEVPDVDTTKEKTASGTVESANNTSNEIISTTNDFPGNSSKVDDVESTETASFDYEITQSDVGAPSYSPDETTNTADQRTDQKNVETTELTGVTRATTLAAVEITEEPPDNNHIEPSHSGEGNGLQNEPSIETTADTVSAEGIEYTLQTTNIPFAGPESNGTAEDNLNTIKGETVTVDSSAEISNNNDVTTHSTQTSTDPQNTD